MLDKTRENFKEIIVWFKEKIQHIFQFLSERKLEVGIVVVVFTLAIIAFTLTVDSNSVDVVAAAPEESWITFSKMTTIGVSETITEEITTITTTKVTTSKTPTTTKPTTKLTTVITTDGKKLGIFKLTVYCSCEKCCNEYAKNRPLDENGKEIVYGAAGRVLIPKYSVAVDPKIIPLGTEIIIDGQIYRADDTGEKVKGNVIDIYSGPNHQEACDMAAAMTQRYKEVYLK